MQFSWGLFVLVMGMTMVSGCKNLHRIEGNWWRSAQPKPEWLKGFVEEEQIDVILCLRGDRQGAPDHDAVVATAKESGIEVVPIGISANKPLNRSQVLHLLDFLDKHANDTVLVHCKAGADRAGLVAYLYLAEVKGWEHRKARDRALSVWYGHFKCSMLPWATPEIDRFVDSWKGADWARQYYGIDSETESRE